MLIESSLYKQLQPYSNAHIIIAYSGGIDSQVLLHALARITSKTLSHHITNTISVCHVNHGISANAFQWEIFAEQECKLRQLPIDICRVQVKAQAQQSLEALARDARYNAIKSLVANKKHKKVIVVTGHHKDDQTETFLLALKRGSGLKGLSSMKQALPLTESITLFRPLLDVTRSDIENYAQTHELTWIDDESNDDTCFDRNFLRHNVVPIIKERWPSFLNTVNRSAEHCQEAEQLLAELAEQDMQKISVSSSILSLTQLMTLSQARFNNVIRYFLKENNGLMPSRAQLKQLYLQLFAEGDKTPKVKVGEYWLRRYQQYLHLTRDFNDVTDFQHTIDVDTSQMFEQKIQLPDQLGVACFRVYKKNSRHETDKVLHIKTPTKEQTVTLTFVHSNPTCTPNYRQHSRALKKILQELNIPPWERKRLPFLYYEQQLVAVLGYFVCKEYMPKEGDEKVAVTWLLGK